MRSHPRWVLPGSLPHLGFMPSSCSWAERCTVSETTRRLQAVRPPGPQREEDIPAQKGPEDSVLDAPVEFPEAILQAPEMSPWHLGPSFG